MIKHMVLGAGILLATGAAQAAFISWDDGEVVFDASNQEGWVSQDGDLVSAINASDSANASVNYGGIEWVNANNEAVNAGVTQNGVTISSSGLAYANAFGPGQFTDIENFYNGGNYNFTSLTLTGLTPGATYQLQIMCIDDRGTDGRWTAFGDGTQSVSDSVTAGSAGACAVRTNPAGQAGVLVGTFKADDATQTIDIFGSRNSMYALDSGSTCQFNALQLRELIVGPVVILSTAAGDSVAGPYSVTVNFSEVVTGLEATDFSVVNGTASGLSGSGTNWAINITPASNGDVSVSLPADSVISEGGLSNNVGNTLITTYVSEGTEQPVATLSTAVSDTHTDFSVQIEFSEEVTGLELSDFEVVNGIASNLTGFGSSYTVVIIPDLNGEVTVSLKRSSVTDIDGDNLPNPASNELSVIHYLSVMVDSLEALKPYLAESYVNVTLAPGTYSIAANAIQNGTFNHKTTLTIEDRTWSHSIVLKFAGNYSTYDFTGVTIYFDSGLWHDNDYGDNGVYQVETTGNYNVLKNLTMIDDGTVNDDPRDGCVNVVMDGAYNRIEGFHITSRGSYPYGYGDCFGKGGGPVISHNKHSTFLVRGESNHAKNCTLIHRTYGHAMFMQAANNPTIEGCYIEGEMRSTDDMLLEEGTESPADDVDFLTTWGYRLPSGYMKSTGEGGIRAYNAGETVINGVPYSRGTSNPTIIDNTIVNMRTGVTLTHASGTKYVAGCKTIGCERGYAIGRGIIENCSGDVQYGPVFGVDYDSDSGVTADITILPYTGEHYNGSRHFAYIFGSDHNLTFRGLEQFPDQELEINVGGDLRIESSYDVVENRGANGIVINNYTGYPLILDDASSGNSGRSCGSITDDGTGNSFTADDWSVVSNVTFYGEAIQSSTYYDSSSKLSALASLAIDQKTDGNFANGSVTHTNYESQPWWRVDLKKLYDISEIRIWGRTLSSQSRLSNYDVTVLDESGDPVWTSYQADYPNPMVSLNTGSAVGRYVLVQLRGSERLSIAEVEIFGSAVAEKKEIAVSTHGWSIAPIVSNNDLAQTQYESSSATGGNEAAQHAQLFNGTLGNADTDSNDSGEVQLSSENTVTVTFDTSVNTNGYDLTGITSYFGWNTSAGGRANQGYEIILTYTDGAVATLVGPNHWDPNSPTSFYWTKVAFTDESYGVMASGVKAVTFNITEDANAGGYVVAREIDIFGTPTLAEKHYLPEFIYGGTTVSNGNFITPFSGEPGESYTVEWAPGLTNEWETVTNIVSLETSPLMLTMPATNSAGFYRVIWNP
ncbi:Ig-like domain-containing protein [Pontiellaceae bacterium B1224]|nr:Ig-like domain-containing protein [Pontiellaceae bacterium B1224]